MHRVRVANIPLPVFVSLKGMLQAVDFPFFCSDFQSFNLSVVAGTVLGLEDI